MSPEPAKAFFDAFCNRVRAAHSTDKVAEGVFGAYMEVSLVCSVAYPYKNRNLTIGGSR